MTVNLVRSVRKFFLGWIVVVGASSGCKSKPDSCDETIRAASALQVALLDNDLTKAKPLADRVVEVADVKEDYAIESVANKAKELSGLIDEMRRTRDEARDRAIKKFLPSTRRFDSSLEELHDVCK